MYEDIDEADYTLAFARLLKQEARFLDSECNHEFYIIRESDASMPFAARKKKADAIGVDLIVSLHVNANNQKTAEAHRLKGTQVFYRANEPLGRQYASLLHSILPDDYWGKAKDIHMTEDAIQWDNAAESVLRAYEPTPAVLIELGFCDTDYSRLITINSKYIQAYAILESIMRLGKERNL